MELPKSLIEKLKRESIDKQKREIVSYLEENNRTYQLLISLQQQEPRVRKNISGLLNIIDDAIIQIQGAFWHGHSGEVRINPSTIAEHKKREVEAYLTLFEETAMPYFKTASQIPETQRFIQDLDLSLKPGDLNNLKSKVKSIELKVCKISLMVPALLDAYFNDTHNSL